MPLHDVLDSIARIQKDTRTARVSSWDQTGKNQDYWKIPPGETVTLADLEGPGCIQHIWMTTFCRRILGPGLIDPVLGNCVAPVYEIHNALGVNWEVTDPSYYRKALIRITWDDQAHPSVLVPLGDFFCIGHSLPGNLSSIPFTVSVKPEERNKFGGQAACNCYLPMPFGSRAKIELINENDAPLGVYFHIDYALYRQPLPPDIGYLHASWRRECPCDGWAPELQVNTPEVNIPNLDGKGNFVVLQAEGEGQFIGCNLSVKQFNENWVEGDDMIFVDGEAQPSINGTGTEDYFGHAWGMQKNDFPFSGAAIHGSDMPGYWVCYRFHLPDPIRFEKSIKVTIEHSHANHNADDWSSTAYWYQRLPGKRLSIAPVADRLPLIASFPQLARQEPELTEEMRAAKQSAARRRAAYEQIKHEQVKAWGEKVQAQSMGNTEDARTLRAAFMRRED